MSDPPCRHCKSFGDAHVDGKCLFDSTSFEPMNEQELSEFVKEYLNRSIAPFLDKFKTGAPPNVAKRSTN